MTKQQTQTVRRQLRTAFKRDVRAFLRAMTPADIDNIFALAIANRRAQAKQEA